MTAKNKASAFKKSSRHPKIPKQNPTHFAFANFFSKAEAFVFCSCHQTINLSFKYLIENMSSTPTQKNTSQKSNPAPAILQPKALLFFNHSKRINTTINTRFGLQSVNHLLDPLELYRSFGYLSYSCIAEIIKKLFKMNNFYSQGKDWLTLANQT